MYECIAGNVLGESRNKIFIHVRCKWSLYGSVGGVIKMIDSISRDEAGRVHKKSKASQAKYMYFQANLTPVASKCGQWWWIYLIAS